MNKLSLKNVSFKNVSIFVSVAITSIILVYTSMSLFTFDSSNNQKQVAHLQEIITKALVQCYALEGAYPPNLEYLEDNYGIILDDDKYIFHYEIYMSNILPSVTIIEL